MKINTQFFCTALAIGLAILQLPAASAEPSSATPPPSVNGRNVNLVSFGRDGKVLGTYRQISRTNWQEAGANGSKPFNFREVNRDDWSVYLTDDSRKVNIQIDLHTKKIMYSDAGKPTPRELYQVMDPNAKTTGWLASSVDFSELNGSKALGSYSNVARGKWAELNAAGKNTFNFEEVGRDDWSVYLEDRSRNVSIQLDLHTRKVMYQTIGKNDRRALYSITQAK